MNIVQNLVSPSKYNIKCPYAMTGEFYVVHNTANDAPARNEVAYMIRNDNKISFHFAVDDKEVVQGIPENRNAYHAGDGPSGNGNRNGISVEICYSKSGGERFIKAEKNAAKFIAQGLKEKGWGIDRVKKHQDFDGKYCPHRTLDMGWDRFLRMVQNELGKTFDDVEPNAWYADAVAWAVKEGITTGVDENHFYPGNACTRSQVVTMIWRMHGSPEPASTRNPFLDVPKNAWYEKAVLWAFHAGITTGVDSTHFCPGEPCTRAQVVTFLWKGTGQPTPVGKNPFVDVPEGAYFEKAVAWAVNAGITTGVDAAHFCPNNVCNRAQVVTFLYRMNN